MAELGNLIADLRRHEEEHQKLRESLTVDAKAASAFAGLEKLRESFAIHDKIRGSFGKIETPMLDTIASFKASERFAETVNSVAASSLWFVDQIKHERRQFESMIEGFELNTLFTKSVKFDHDMVDDLPSQIVVVPPAETLAASEIADLQQRVANLEAALEAIFPPPPPSAGDKTDDGSSPNTGQYI